MNERSSRKTFNRLSAAAMTAFAALVLAAAPARAGSSPQGALDECYGKPLAVHVTGWTFDPDVSSQSIGIQVNLYTDSNCTTLYDNPTLTANVPRPDVNQLKGVAGDHGFNADIPVVSAGTYWVKVFAADATGDGNVQVGTTRSVTVAPGLPGSGTPADPYVISSAADWNIFAANIGAGFGSDSRYRLDADVGPVSTTVGTAEHPFAGVFDGGSNTLTVALSGSDRAIAPFSAISGATIRNLKVEGAVSCAIHCSGLVGEVFGGTNLIEGCEVAAAITCSASHFGGFIGHGVTYAVTLRGCVFSGSLSGGTYVATFNGWSDDGAATTLVDCLDASTSDQPIGRGEGAVCVSNTLYLASKDFGNGERLWSAANRGKRGYSVTAGEGVVLDFGEPLRAYGGSGLAVHRVGLARGGALYAEAGATVALRPAFTGTPPAGKEHDSFAASAGEFVQNGDSGAWELAMPGGNVVISATYESISTPTVPAVLARQCGAFGIVTYDLPPVTETQTTPVPVPYAWLDAHVPGMTHETEAHEAAAKATAANGRPVWACYALGLDPQDAASDFRIASFPMKADGTPDFANVVFDPPKAQWNVPDAPVTWKGSATLEGPWRTVTVEGGSPGTARPTMQFFKAVVFAEADDDLGGVQLWKDGPYWAKCNVGAEKPEEYGYYFWWGDTVGYTRSGGTWTEDYYYYYSGVTWVSSAGEQMSSSPFSSCPTSGKDNSALQSAGYIDSTGNLVAAHDAATAHLGAPWRMPTSDEIQALVDNCTTTWITTNGVSGRLVTGKGNYANRSIFLPAAGLGYDSDLYGPGSLGDYWSSTPNSDGSSYAWYLYFGSSYFSRNDYGRYYGQSVRPVRDAD